jgi:hypothetical protein
VRIILSQANDELISGFQVRKEPFFPAGTLSVVAITNFLLEVQSSVICRRAPMPTRPINIFNLQHQFNLMRKPIGKVTKKIPSCS